MFESVENWPDNWVSSMISFDDGDGDDDDDVIYEQKIRNEDFKLWSSKNQ